MVDGRALLNREKVLLGAGKLVNFYTALGISDYPSTLPQVNFINNSSIFYQELISASNPIHAFLDPAHAFVYRFTVS